MVCALIGATRVLDEINLDEIWPSDDSTRRYMQAPYARSDASENTCH